MPVYALSRTPQREAHYQVARAIRHGTLPRPSDFSCADCSRQADRYDHRDYAKPLDVAPVCRRCNCRRGRALNGGRPLAAQARKHLPPELIGTEAVPTESPLAGEGA